jgi:hypothetical protein
VKAAAPGTSAPHRYAAPASHRRSESGAAAIAASCQVPVLATNRERPGRGRVAGSGSHPKTDAGGSVTTRGACLPAPRWDYASFSSRQPPGSGW